MVTIAIESPHQPEVDDLLRRGADYALALYPAEGCFLLSADELASENSAVFIARDPDGSALGMVALVQLDATVGEVKRLFVHDHARRSGAASALMDALEQHARALNLDRVVLETGTRHDAAQAFYSRRGYLGIDAFGPYVDNEFSVCMEKVLMSSV